MRTATDSEGWRVCASVYCRRCAARGERRWLAERLRRETPFASGVELLCSGRFRSPAVGDVWTHVRTRLEAGMGPGQPKAKAKCEDWFNGPVEIFCHGCGSPRTVRPDAVAVAGIVYA